MPYTIIGTLTAVRVDFSTCFLPRSTDVAIRELVHDHTFSQTEHLVAILPPPALIDELVNHRDKPFEDEAKDCVS